MESRETPHVLQVEGVEQQEGSEGRKREDGDRAGAREGDAAEEAHFQQRLGAAALVGDERRQREAGDDEQPQRLG